MRKCERCRNLILGALYDELPVKEKTWFQDHLKECENCRLQFEKYRETMQVMDQKQEEKLPDEYWEGYWNQLLSKLDSRKTVKGRNIPARKRLTLVFPSLPAWSYKLGFALMILILGIFLGKVIFLPSPESIPDKINRYPNYGTMTSLDARTYRFLEKSKILLLGIINYDPEADEVSSFNLDHNRNISQHLVEQIPSLQNDLESSSQGKLSRLIADLELILMQIANLESEEDISQIELIQSGVEQRSILMKITINEMEKDYDSQPAVEGQKSKI